MRHRKGGFKLSRNPASRRALLRGLTTSLILEERIVTTVTRAKAVRPQIEKMITLAKRDTLHSRRQAAAYVQTPEAVQKLFDKVGPRFADRPGGYTRILRMGVRKGDGAESAMIELLGAEVKRTAEERRRRREERIQQQQEQTEAAEEASEE